MNNKNEKELENKVQDIFDNHFDEISYYKDMDFKSEIDMKGLIEKAKKKPHKSYRGLKIASLFLIVFLCSSTFAVLITSGSVEAGKDKIMNIINSIKGDQHKITDESYNIEINDIDDSDSISKARDLIPNLVILNEIDGDFIFDMMTINKINKNEIFASSFYFNSNDEMLRLNQSKFDDGTNPDLSNTNNIIEIGNGFLLLTKDIDGEIGINSAKYIENNMSITLIGEQDLISLERIMKDSIIPQLELSF